MPLRTLALLVLGAPSLLAQTIVLDLRPRTGDTLRMQLDQVTQIAGTRGNGRPLSVRTGVSMFSRAIVLGSDTTGALILTVTDSVLVQSNDERAREMFEQARRSLEGRQVKLRLAPDGTVALEGAAREVARDVRDMVSIMPGSFPRQPIAVGDTWTRVMPIPGREQLDLPAGGRVRARFRLDSVSRNGDFAYVGMRGAFEPADSAGSADAAAGSVTGALVINRRRGWLSESRFLIQMRSTVPVPGRPRSPMRFQTRITQYMRVLEERAPGRRP